MPRAPFVLLVGGPLLKERMATLADHLRTFAPKAEFVVVPDTAAGERYLPEAEIVILGDRVSPAYVSAPRLSWLHFYSTGIDHHCIPQLRGASYPITHKVLASVVPMAEHACTLMLSIVRRLREYHDLQRLSEWRPPTHSPTTELGQLAGATIAIVGLGHAGCAIARRAKAFDMTVIGVKREVVGEVEHVDRVLAPSALKEALAAADFVVLATSLNDDTFHLIGTSQLGVMKPTAWLINLSRGSVVDEPALIAALRAESIAGAALDVFEQEPLAVGSPLWGMPNVIVTPHAAGSGPDNEIAAIREIAANFERYLAGRPMTGLVNPADIPIRSPGLGH